MVCFLAQWEVLGIRDVCLRSFVSLGAQALACPDAEAAPLRGAQTGWLEPVWRGGGGAVAAGGPCQDATGGRKEGGRAGGLWGAGRSALQVFLLSSTWCLILRVGPVWETLGDPWSLSPSPRLPWSLSGLFYQSPQPLPPETGGNLPRMAPGGPTTKGDRVWGFHPCGQCRTQGCVSLEAKRDWERAEWNPDRRDAGEKPHVQRSNLLAMPPTLNLLLGLPLA